MKPFIITAGYSEKALQPLMEESGFSFGQTIEQRDLPIAIYSIMLHGMNIMLFQTTGAHPNIFWIDRNKFGQR